MCQPAVQVSEAHSSFVDALLKVFNRPVLNGPTRVLRVTDYEEVDETGAPSLSAAVTGPMDLNSMRRLLEAEAVQGPVPAQCNLAFIDSSVPDRMLYSPAISRNLTQPMSWHLAAAQRSFYPVWTLHDIMRVSTAEELADAEAFAREHYGPAPPPGTDLQRPARRQRRGCRGGKGRKRHAYHGSSQEPESDRSGSLTLYSPRIMSAFSGVLPPYAAPTRPLSAWSSAPPQALPPMPTVQHTLPPYIHTGFARSGVYM